MKTLTRQNLLGDAYGGNSFVKVALDRNRPACRLGGHDLRARAGNSRCGRPNGLCHGARGVGVDDAYFQGSSLDVFRVEFNFCTQ